jgi:GTPase SAR1 family protein
LIQLEDVMDEPMNLGPNGGLVYCIEHLEKNFDWLATKITNDLKNHYLIIDCPGQVELYTHNNAIKNIISRLEKECSVRLCAVHLVDAHYCADASKFVAVCLTSLTTMLQLELPHVNILSKIDLIEKYGKLDFNIDYYTEVQDLDYLLDRISDDPFAGEAKLKLFLTRNFHTCVPG